MTMRFAVGGLVSVTRSRSMQSSLGATRYFTEGKGRILSEEERAKENVYIQKMERERHEKMKQKAEKEKAEKEKHSGDKNTEGTQKD